MWTPISSKNVLPCIATISLVLARAFSYSPVLSSSWFLFSIGSSFPALCLYFQSFPFKQKLSPSFCHCAYVCIRLCVPHWVHMYIGGHVTVRKSWRVEFFFHPLVCTGFYSSLPSSYCPYSSFSLLYVHRVELPFWVRRNPLDLARV